MLLPQHANDGRAGDPGRRPDRLECRYEKTISFAGRSLLARWMVLDVVLEAVAGVAEAVALLAGAPLAQIAPTEDAVLVAVVPVEADGVVADLLHHLGADGGLEHGQRSKGRRRGRGGLIGQPAALLTLLVAQRTG